MDCTEIRPLISAYYDGEATPDEHAQVEAHLARCGECRSLLAEYRAIGSDIRALAVPVPPVGLRRDVWRAIEAQHGGVRPRSAVAEPSPNGRSNGKVVVMPDPRRAQPRRTPATAPAWSSSSWLRSLPAAVLIGGLLIVLAVLFLRNNYPVALAAQLKETQPLVDYGQPVHVMFTNSVVHADAENNTHVREVSSSPVITVPVSPSWVGNELALKPDGTWEPGARYQVFIDAPRISLGVGEAKLASQPITLDFTAAAHTPTPTATATDTAVPTDTPVRPTDTPQPTAVAQNTPGQPPVVVPTEQPQGKTPVPAKPSATQGTVPNGTPQPQPSNTPVPPSSTPVPSNTPVPPSPTETSVPTDTPRPTATQRPSSTPAPPGATPSASGTATPVHRGTATPTPGPRVSATPTPPMACNIPPVRGFGKVWTDNADARNRIGCPVANELGIADAVHEHFQGGYMFWRGDTRTIYVFVGAATDTYGQWYEFPDTWNDGDPMPQPTVTPPGGLYAPVRGFGKLWYGNEDIRMALGWATEPEVKVTGAWQSFERGSALWVSDKTIRFLYNDGIWQRFEDKFDQ